MNQSTSSISKMEMGFSSCDSGSVDNMLKNILSSMEQPPPSSSSSCPKDQILQNIKNLPASLIYTSSPYDVSLADENSGDEKSEPKMPLQHLRQYEQMMKQEMFETTSDDMEYLPPPPALQEDMGLGLGLEGLEGDEMVIKGKLG